MSSVKNKENHITVLVIKTPYNPEEIGPIQLCMDLASEASLLSRSSVKIDNNQLIEQIIQELSSGQINESQLLSIISVLRKK